jgi:ASCH domain
VEPVLTIRQPWASAIFVAGKNVENRTWRTHYRGRLWIHAARHASRREQDRWTDEHGLWVPQEPLPRGAIIGAVELVDCVEDSESPWALAGHYHWLLCKPMLLERPVPRAGELGLRWIRPPRGGLKRVRRSRRSSA